MNNNKVNIHPYLTKDTARALYKTYSTLGQKQNAHVRTQSNIYQQTNGEGHIKRHK